MTYSPAAATVTGVKITYNLKDSISADLKAQVQNKVLTVGGARTPAEVKVDVGDTA